MKNTAYAFAKDHLDGSIEDYGRALAEHFLESPQVDVATVNIRAHHWRRIDVAGTPAPDAFVRGGEGTRVATVTATGAGTTVEAGVEDLIVMKTTRSAFSGFPRDRVHDPARDRRPADGDQGHRDLALRLAGPRLRRRRSRTSGRRSSRSSPTTTARRVQTSIWIMARAILERHDEVEEVRMVLPNLHHWLVDLTPFGLENDREVYIADDRAARPHRGDRATRARAETMTDHAPGRDRAPPARPVPGSTGS